jgi:hypothetical protein
MKLVSKAILAILSSSLVLLGCGQDNPVLPDVVGAQGFVQAGWDAYRINDFETAMDYFQQAIDAAVDWPDGYLGAGWTAIFLDDYWNLASNYFYMATQFDGGTCPVIEYSESQTQDTLWTVFQCVDPVLPDSVMQVIEALGDSMYFGGSVDTTYFVDPLLLGKYLYGANPFVGYGPEYGPIAFTYRFQPTMDDCLALFTLENGFTNILEQVDSITVEAGETWIYINVPYTGVVITGDTYRTWIAADNLLAYDYVTYTPGGNATQITWDALAGWALLEEVRGDNSNGLMANAAIWGLYSSVSAYDFGAGELWDTAESFSEVQLKGVAASTAFLTQAFRFSWFSCLSVGYGLSLDPDDPGFVFELMQLIETML